MEAKDKDTALAEGKQGELKPKKLNRVTAISLAPPGHFRGNHYWQSGQPTYADVTDAQLVQIQKDRRLQILEGEIRNAIPERAVLKAIADENNDARVLEEAKKILERRKSRESEAGAIRRKLEVGR